MVELIYLVEKGPGKVEDLESQVGIGGATQKVSHCRHVRLEEVAT